MAVGVSITLCMCRNFVFRFYSVFVYVGKGQVITFDGENTLEFGNEFEKFISFFGIEVIDAKLIF